MLKSCNNSSELGHSKINQSLTIKEIPTKVIYLIVDVTFYKVA